VVSKKDRFSGTVNQDRSIIRSQGDALDSDSNWRPWMDITLTREAS
jgi:hypothetical protein